MLLPESIRMHLPKGQYSLDDIGRSGAQVLMFEDRVLKIEKDCNMAANELQMMKFLKV